MSVPSDTDLKVLSNLIRQWAKSLGFTAIGVSDIEFSQHRKSIEEWLNQGFHGSMSFLERNQELRLNPALLHEGTVSIISVRMDYLPQNARFAASLEQANQGYISRYAVGRDYHKVMRKRLKQLADRISQYCHEEWQFEVDARPFVDSAPVLERPIAEKAGLGWEGKHSLLIDGNTGSWFFLGELMINLPLKSDAPIQPNQCGECVACIKICPTQAIVAPYVIDARRCISYLTIEHNGAIEESLRPLMGNRIYGCDDCQLICPWNRHSDLSQEADFQTKEIWRDLNLLTLWQWDETTFLHNTAGTPIRRIGYEKWQRNLAIAIGNGPYAEETINILQSSLGKVSPMVDEHIGWAIAQLKSQSNQLSRKSARLIRSIRTGIPRDAD